MLADPDKIAWAVHLREQGEIIAQIVAKTGVARTSLYRHMPPRPAEPLTADGEQRPRQETEVTPTGVGRCGLSCRFL